ncbi:peptidase [Devosia epidermidihirudinis]|uniref:Peptidase n=1 Tax=Devosia epidermidihirudinis TaxID=1293439 RepID=A0A0F5Q4V9_9HYPH|nr:dipeptidase [Devosia epidermidihirudinis]KKC35925.1 peptidase [Devosia epidermidihirudinis]
MNKLIPVFDGHNDALLRLLEQPSADPVQSFLTGEAPAHLDLPKAQAGGLVGGLFAVFCPSPGEIDRAAMQADAYDLPLPNELSLEAAQRLTIAQVAILQRLANASNGAVALCRSTAEIRAANARGALAAVLHIEGAEAIDPDLYFLDVLYAAGLRSVGPVWSRTNIFGYGVPFRFPGLPDTGPGLTDAGRRLVAACNRMRVLVDLSHITEQGFWDVAKISDAPLVATHSNAYALSPSPRNLTDEQLRAIRDSDGLVGLNFGTGFLRLDGRLDTSSDPELLVRHLDHLISIVGESRIGLGSDFDGTKIPDAIGSAAGLPVLFDLLRRHGYDEPLLERIGYSNWLSVLERTIG